LFTIGLLAACRKQANAPDAVARFEGGVISSEQLRNHLASVPDALRQKYASPEARKQLVQRLIDVELLAAEAERRGLGKHPEVERARKQQMIALLLRSDDGQIGARPPAAVDEAARRYYEGHYGEFHKDPEVKVADVVLTNRRHLPVIQKDLRPAQRTGGAPDREAAEAMLLRWVSAGNVEIRELGFLSARSPGVDRTILDAALALSTPGQIAGPLESQGALHLLLLRERRAGHARPFVEVKRQILESLERTDREARMKDLAAQLRQQAGVQIDEAAIATVSIDPRTPGQ
jgi:peptidyl-prolyl cis-trans isomerase C